MVHYLIKKRQEVWTLLFVICVTVSILIPSTELQILAAEKGDSELAVEDQSPTAQNSYGDYKYKILNSGKVEITGYLGTASNITIPSEIDGREVGKIGENAFYGYNNLKSVIIPKGVYYIDAFAFSGCSKLKSVTMPDTVLYINSGAFSECKSLSDVKIPQGVKEIWCNAFDSCSSLKEITIPDSVYFIGSNVFWGCSNLTRIEFQSNIVKFKDGYSFDFLFYGCNNLKGIALNNSDCFTKDGIIYQYNNGIKLLYYPRGKTGTVTIPSYVKSIKESAFEDCKKIRNVVIPENCALESIPESAFEGCSNLRNVTILNGVKKIEGWAFCDCSNLRSVTIPKSVTSIEMLVFFGNDRLKNVYYEGSRKQWEKISIDGGNSDLTNATIHYKTNIKAPSETSVLKSGKNTYKVTTKGSAVSFVKTSNTSSKITVPANVTINGVKYKVTSIADKAFVGNKKLKNVVIGNNVTSIGKNAFTNCKKLTNVIVGTKVKKIGNEAFKGCPELGKITIKSTNLTSVGKNVFKGIKSTAKIKVPAKKLIKYKKLLNSKGQGKKVRISS